MQTRDPRIDPQPGDVVGKTMNEKRFFRLVYQRTQPGLYGVNFVVYQNPGGFNACTLLTWREWCRDAEVLHAA